MMHADRPRLHRIRWGVRAALVLGVAASVTANILHANPNPISQTIAAWPPLALLLTVELISRVPVHRRSLAAVRFIATTAIAGIAAWVSYWHMVGVASRYGETGAAPYLLPVSVDGLVVVASVCLVELSGRIRAAEMPVVAPLEARLPATEQPVGEQPGQAEPDAPRKRVPATRRRVAGNATKVARAHAKYPAATNAEIAERAGVSVRSVVRHRPAKPQATTPATTPANNTPVPALIDAN